MRTRRMDRLHQLMTAKSPEPEYLAQAILKLLDEAGAKERLDLMEELVSMWRLLELPGNRKQLSGKFISFLEFNEHVTVITQDFQETTRKIRNDNATARQASAMLLKWIQEFDSETARTVAFVMVLGWLPYARMPKDIVQAVRSACKHESVPEGAMLNENPDSDAIRLLHCILKNPDLNPVETLAAIGQLVTKSNKVTKICVLNGFTKQLLQKATRQAHAEVSLLGILFSSEEPEDDGDQGANN